MPTRKQMRKMAEPPAKDEREGLFGVYVRRSEDDERSKSCDDQEQLGRRAGKAKGYPPERIRIYREIEGTKGTWTFRQTGRPGPHREQMSQLVDDIRVGITTHLWSWNSDRIVRDPQVCLDLCEELREHRVALTINAKDIDTSTNDGLYGLVRDSIEARKQRDRASEDVTRDKQFRAEMGLFTRDPSCYGWRSGGRDSQEAVPQWDELAVVEMCMQWISHGDGVSGPLGFNQVACRLMDLGISLSVEARGHRAKDPKRVTPAQVERIASNCMHVGRWLHGDVEHDFSEKLLVSRHGEPTRTAVPEALYEAVHARMEAMPERTARSAGTERLCKGVAVCGSCGHALLVNVKEVGDGKRVERYFCPRRAGRRKTCVGEAYATIVVPELERWVRERLAPQLSRELDAMGAEAAGGPLRRELAQARRALADATRTEAESLVRMLGAGYDDAQRAVVAESLRAERRRLERTVQEVEAKVERKESAAQGAATLESVSVPRLREALGRTLQWLAVTNRGVVCLDREGRYLRSPFVERDLTVYNDGDNRRMVAPSVEAGGRDWLLDAEAFVAGRRERMGRRADGLEDDKILPHNPAVEGLAEDCELRKERSAEGLAWMSRYV